MRGAHTCTGAKPSKDQCQSCREITLLLFSIHPKQINHKPKVLLLGESGCGRESPGWNCPWGVQARLGALGHGREGKEMGLSVPAKPQQCASVRVPPCKILCLCNCFVCLGWFCFGLVFSSALFAFTFSFCFVSGAVFCSGSCEQHPDPGSAGNGAQAAPALVLPSQQTWDPHPDPVLGSF